MNTHFKILWFEDEISWFNMEKLKVETILDEHFLIPYIDRKDGDDFKIEELTGNIYDLIIMDYKLAAGETGDKILNEIRNDNILTDVLFYSSQEKEMIAAVSKGLPQLDGVYLTKRENELFTQKAKNLIKKIVKRSEDIVNLRGFVLDCSSDFEVRIKGILSIVWDKFNNDEKQILDKEIQNNIQRIEKRNNSTKQKVLQADPVFPEAIKNNYFFSHSDRLFVLDKTIKILLDNYNLSKEIEYESFKSNYEEKISHYRNALGHRKSTENTIIIKEKKTPIDEELHQMMRKNISRYNFLIEQLEKCIEKL